MKAAVTRKEVDKQLRRANMSLKEKRIRRFLFRIQQGSHLRAEAPIKNGVHGLDFRVGVKP